MSAFGKHHVSGIAISPDNRTLAAGYWDLVTLWSVFTGERLGILRGFKRYVGGLAFSPDGKLLAGGTDTGGLRIWDVGRLTRIASLDVDGVGVSVPAFSPDGRFLITPSTGGLITWPYDQGGTIRVFRVNTR